MDVVSAWFVTRASEIEEFSGQVNTLSVNTTHFHWPFWQVDCAFQLVELGMEKGIKVSLLR